MKHQPSYLKDCVRIGPNAERARLQDFPGGPWVKNLPVWCSIKCSIPSPEEPVCHGVTKAGCTIVLLEPTCPRVIHSRRSLPGYSEKVMQHWRPRAAKIKNNTLKKTDYKKGIGLSKAIRKVRPGHTGEPYLTWLFFNTFFCSIILIK